MTDRNYEILSGDTLVAVWNNNKLSVVNETLLPLYLKKIQNADLWLETRAIDSHRSNSRLLKKALRLVERDDISTVIHVNGATITDNYWVRPDWYQFEGNRTDVARQIGNAVPPLMAIAFADKILEVLKK